MVHFEFQLEFERANPASRADARVQVSTHPSFRALALDRFASGVADRTPIALDELELQPGAIYVWRVVAEGCHPSETVTCETWSFVLQQASTCERWTTVEDGLSTSRRWPTLSLLPDGRVLGAGGHRALPPDEVDLWDPYRNVWQAGPRLNRARVRLTATVLRDGRVLDVGGEHYTGTELVTLSTSEIYDPERGVWDLLRTPLDVPRYGHTANLLPDGRVAVHGGHGADRTPIAVAQSFDRERMTWAAPHPILGPRRADTSVLRAPSQASVLLTGSTVRHPAWGRRSGKTCRRIRVAVRCFHSRMRTTRPPLSSMVGSSSPARRWTPTSSSLPPERWPARRS